MNDYLESNDLMNSFGAVRHFLQSAKYNPLHYCKLECKVTIDSINTFDDDFEFECVDHIPTYKLHSYALKSIGYHRSLWSAYTLIVWDENKKELSFTVNKKNIKLKYIL